MITTQHEPRQHRVLSYVGPNPILEWDEAVRYPLFQRIGEAGWIVLVSLGKPVPLSTLGEVDNLDMDFPNLHPEKVRRFGVSYQRGVFEYPLVGQFVDGYECIGGATRIAGLTMKGIDPWVWVIPVHLYQLTPDRHGEEVTHG